MCIFVFNETVDVIDDSCFLCVSGLPGVLFVLPDSYVDPEYKDYGGELMLNTLLWVCLTRVKFRVGDLSVLCVIVHQRLSLEVGHNVVLLVLN